MKYVVGPLQFDEIHSGVKKKKKNSTPEFTNLVLQFTAHDSTLLYIHTLSMHAPSSDSSEKRIETGWKKKNSSVFPKHEL